MEEPSTPSSLTDMLDRIEAAEQSQADKTTMGDIMDQVGRRSFGPFLLVAGIITLVPVIGGIPGVPTIMGLVVLVVAVQLLFGRDHFWLPQWVMNRSIKGNRVKKGVDWMRKPARFFDRLLRQRLVVLTRGAGIYGVAVMCVGIALMMLPMEFVPLSAVLAGVALALFGLALIAHDGLMAAIAFVVTAVTFGMVLLYLL